MKKILTILILIFTLQTPSQADDIRDFQIEGISIGDSLLDYFSKEKIENGKIHYPKSDKFYYIETAEAKYQVYQNIQFGLKKNDKKYIIYSMAGGIFYHNNIVECNKKKDEVVTQIKEIVGDKVNVRISDKYPHSDLYPNTMVESVQIKFESGDGVRIYCIDWSEKMTREKNWKDHLTVHISTKVFIYFINNEAYK